MFAALGKEGWFMGWEKIAEEMYLVLKMYQEGIRILSVDWCVLNCVAAEQQRWKLYSQMALALFWQNNAPCCKSKIVQEWLEDQNNEFEVLTWPLNSPDLSPIKHLLLSVGQTSQTMEAAPCNSEELKDRWLMFGPRYHNSPLGF